jgi:hypothetical protein
VAGEPKYSEKTFASATLSTTNPTRLDPVLNPGRRGGKQATNCLSYGAAVHFCSTKDQFAQLFIGILVNIGFQVRRGKQYPKAGVMIAYLLTNRASELAALCLNRDGSSKAPVTSWRPGACLSGSIGRVSYSVN